MTITDLAQKLRRPARFAWLTVTFFCWALAAVAQLGKTTPYLDIAIHFALQLCWAGAMLTIAALLLRRWRHAIVAATLVLWQIWLVWPAGSTPTIPPATPGVKMRVIELNAWYWNAHPEDIVTYLQNSNADVIGLVEVSPHLQEELTALYKLYPYHAECVTSDPRCEESLLSRWPIDQISAQRIDGHLPVVVTARIHPTPDISFDIAISHLIRPLNWWWPPKNSIYLPATPPTVQAEQAAQLAKRLGQLGPNAIFLGDLNATAWSPVLTAIRQAGNWHPETEIVPSWPSWGSAPLRLPIDHVLTRGKVELTGLASGPILSSDHLPLEADLFIHGKTPE
jgi:endonuclease/exonuclease/phosphatase (EEP) superfamily protein YafD